ncbi:MAG: hypothetical protein ACRDTG_04175 [Pseudonocardiaceae bacterium]
MQQTGQGSSYGPFGVGQLLTRALDPRLTGRLTAERRALDELARPLRRGSSIAVVGLQPAAGRTTVAGLLAHLLAVLGSTRVLAIDCDTRGPGNTRSPDDARSSGDTHHPGLRERLGAGQAGSLHPVFAGLRLEPPGQLRLPPGPPGFRWMSQHLAGTEGPALLAASAGERGRPFPAAHYAVTVGRFGRWYRAIVTDTPAGPSADVLPAVIRRANRLVAVGTADEKGLSGLRATVNWLGSIRPGDLRRLTTVLVAQPGASGLRPDQAQTAVGLPVHVLPPDVHLASQAPLDWTALGERTRRAVLALAAAAVADLAEPLGKKPMGKKIASEGNRSSAGPL